MVPFVETYTGDGVSRIFTVTSTILSESHCRVDFNYIDEGAEDATDHYISPGVWDVINNSIVFREAPGDGYKVKISVSADGEGLDTPPSAITDLAANIDRIISVDNNSDDIDTVADNITDVNTVASMEDNILDVSSDPLRQAIITDSAIATDIINVSNNVAKVTTVSDNMPTIIEVTTDPLKQSILDAEGNATEASESLAEFQDKYYGALAEDPTERPNGGVTAPGDMYLNSLTRRLMVYSGSAWITAGSDVNGLVNYYEVETTEGQFSFTGLEYDIGYMRVYRNGARLPANAFLATDGSTLTLTDPCDALDEVAIESFGAFDTGELNGIITRIDINEANIDGLEDDLGVLEGRVGVNEVDIDNLEARVDASETDIASLEEDVITIDNKLLVIDGEIEDIGEELDSINDAIEAIELDVEELQNRTIAVGFVDYNDVATQSVPLVIPNTGIYVTIPNDTLGLYTNKTYLPSGVTDVWDSVSGLFDFSELSLGDMVDIRVDLAVTTLNVHQTVNVELELGIGGSNYSIPFIETTYKIAGLHNVNRYNGIYIGDVNTLNNGARFRIKSDGNATVKVNGFYCKITRR